MVDKNLVNGLVKEVVQTIDYVNEPIAFPWMGIIINTTNSERADIEVDGKGILRDVPCHGIPVVGDSVIIHFIEGSFNMPVADCPHRLTPDRNVLESYYKENSFNCLDDGDFTDGSMHKGNYEIIEGEGHSLNERGCLLRENGSYIEAVVDISSITCDTFKFQAVYKGMGRLQVECFDADTGGVIKCLPYSMRFEKKFWVSESRYGWKYNKEVYPVFEDGVRHTRVMIRVTNVSEPEEFFHDGEVCEAFESMVLDELLVYCENGDSEFYNSPGDSVRFNDVS